MPLGGAVARLVLLIVSSSVCIVRGFLGSLSGNMALWLVALLLLELRLGRMRLRWPILALAVALGAANPCGSCWVFGVWCLCVPDKWMHK